MRQAYPSDVSREQFEIIRPLLESAKKVTHPRTIDLYDIFCAILYVLREGCRWRSLPHDFPKWQNVYKHFKMWSEPDENDRSLLDRVQKNLSDLNGLNMSGSLRQQ
jgi:transposase